MALSNPRSIFGVHQFSPYNRTTGEFYGTVRVIGDSSLALSGELIQLNGGSSKYPFAVEDGLISAELSLTVREYPSFLFELFLGKAPTENSAEANGSVNGFANKNGTSVVSATTGIASISAKSADEEDLRVGTYVVKAVSATTVDVFASLSLDFGKAPTEDYESDLLKINASPITIADTSATVDLDNFGLTITSGSGTIAMTIGDTATFDVRPPNSGSTEVVVGGSGDVFPEFGAIVAAKKAGSNRTTYIDLFRVKGVGLPLGFVENAFSESSITAQAFQDTARGGVFKFVDVQNLA